MVTFLEPTGREKYATYAAFVEHLNREKGDDRDFEYERGKMFTRAIPFQVSFTPSFPPAMEQASDVERKTTKLAKKRDGKFFRWKKKLGNREKG